MFRINMQLDLDIIPYICSRYAEKGLSAVPIHRGASSELTGQIGKSTTVFFIFHRKEVKKFSFFRCFLTDCFQMDCPRILKDFALLVER